VHPFVYFPALMGDALAVRRFAGAWLRAAFGMS
jgi:hypothetical protein